MYSKTLENGNKRTAVFGHFFFFYKINPKPARGKYGTIYAIQSVIFNNNYLYNWNNSTIKTKGFSSF